MPRQTSSRTAKQSGAAPVAAVPEAFSAQSVSNLSDEQRKAKLAQAAEDAREFGSPGTGMPTFDSDDFNLSDVGDMPDFTEGKDKSQYFQPSERTMQKADEFDWRSFEYFTGMNREDFTSQCRQQGKAGERTFSNIIYGAGYSEFPLMMAPGGPGTKGFYLLSYSARASRYGDIQRPEIETVPAPLRETRTMSDGTTRTAWFSVPYDKEAPIQMYDRRGNATEVKSKRMVEALVYRGTCQASVKGKDGSVKEGILQIDRYYKNKAHFFYRWQVEKMANRNMAHYKLPGDELVRLNDTQMSIIEKGGSINLTKKDGTTLSVKINKPGETDGISSAEAKANIVRVAQVYNNKSKKVEKAVVDDVLFESIVRGAGGWAKTDQDSNVYLAVDMFRNRVDRATDPALAIKNELQKQHEEGMARVNGQSETMTGPKTDVSPSIPK